ncbi:hypothetical protein GMST_12710 [Geomonas silvestris]|uniref:Uncharacterized protein n=1 Tax=Geomonas silvestris TaxID=2740184 RepID=A0A6V8MG29_9BACT|nr:hypothetical protein [Geomonas silvestris]GFO58946.1 hypothetical protein GMST_12710 [Geomonas silvestris]
MAGKTSKSGKKRIKRNFRNFTPTPLLNFCLRVKRGLTDNTYISEAFWAMYGPLRQRLFEATDRYEGGYQVATDGARSQIREREKLAEELVALLDEMASALESASFRDPAVLLSTGYDLTVERRSTPREKPPLGPPTDFRVENLAEPSKVLGTVSNMMSAIIQEIHINTQDPAVEAHWRHKGIYFDPANMVIEGLEPGNVFFRMRYLREDGPGPWSPIVTTPVT